MVNETTRCDFIYLGWVKLFLFCVIGMKTVSTFLGVF